MRKIYSVIIVFTIVFSTACEDFAFGDKFLQKPPSTDVTIDTVFSTAEYARQVLWYSYNHLPYGFSTGATNKTAMFVGNIESLTDLNQNNAANSGPAAIYYPGIYDAGNENKRPSADGAKTAATKFRFYEYGTWEGIRHAWLFYENVDDVPDMSDEEKSRMKAEAKTLIATFYVTMLRHYGAVPIIDHALKADEQPFPARPTLQETVDFIVELLDDAINCPEFPWALPVDERITWDGRLTKASAMGLKVRLLLFVASPLFNSPEPYYLGEASDKLMTWFGNEDMQRWEDAVRAGEDFFRMMDSEGYYKLVTADNPGNTWEEQLEAYRQAFQDAYYTRGTTEQLISSHRTYYRTGDLTALDQSMRFGGYCPTKEYFDMFPMNDGSDFDWNNPTHRANPFINRDPRIYETIIMDGDKFQGGKAEVFQAKPGDETNYPKGKNWLATKVTGGSTKTGIACRKFGLDRGGEYNNRIIHWPLLRLAEIYLSHAEALNEVGHEDALGHDAYYYIDAVRARVGLNGLPKGLSKEEFREAVLRERACEFGWEEVRFFDLIRWKREDILTQHLHGLNVYRHKDTKAYEFEVWQLEERAWQKANGFSPKWYLSAFPSDEINKKYGLVQNPGW